MPDIEPLGAVIEPLAEPVEPLADALGEAVVDPALAVLPVDGAVVPVADGEVVAVADGDVAPVDPVTLPVAPIVPML